MLEESNERVEAKPTSSAEIPLFSESDDIASANDNGLPVVDNKTSNGSGSSNSGSLSNAFR